MVLPSNAFGGKSLQVATLMTRILLFCAVALWTSVHICDYIVRAGYRHYARLLQRASLALSLNGAMFKLRDLGLSVYKLHEAACWGCPMQD
jgi:hypothetical protein